MAAILCSEPSVKLESETVHVDAAQPLIPVACNNEGNMKPIAKLMLLQNSRQ